jgi:hypothetical protein
MDMKFSIEPKKHQLAREIDAIEKCNAYTAPYGLVLSRTQIQNLVAHRFAALKQTRRMEFGQGILEKLIEAFCDSPYIHESNYEETLLELQDMFYHFKNEVFEQLSDDELILSMKTGFNGPGHGSLEYVAGTWVETLTRRMRTGGWGFEETIDSEEEDEND